MIRRNKDKDGIEKTYEVLFLVFCFLKTFQAGSSVGSQVGMGPPPAHEGALATLSHKSLNKKSKNVGTELVGAPACGDIMQLQVQGDEKRRIVDVRFKIWPVATAPIRPLAWESPYAAGAAQEMAKKKKKKDLAVVLQLPPPRNSGFLLRLHCSLLVEGAVQAALADDTGKQEPKKAEMEKKGILGEASAR
uniref:NIF system FeS cluster assembly NifU N-terminal domain-containing protein n=2 Tax=Sus scrofa TaxID=9823 RepID=A0A8D0LU80_PIG